MTELVLGTVVKSGILLYNSLYLPYIWPQLGHMASVKKKQKQGSYINCSVASYPVGSPGIS